MAESIVKLIVDATQGIRSLGRFKKATGEAAKKAELLQKSVSKAGVSAKRSAKQIDAVDKAASKLTSTVTKLTAAFSFVQAARFVFVKTAEIEKQAKSLEVLTGSVDKAKNIIKELQDFGSVTPFTSSELIETAKRLKAFGVDTAKLVETTKRLGDVAGATGADLSGIATAYGQIQAKGKLQTEELLQLQERGVDLAGVLKKEYGLTGEEFSKALQKGKISAEAAEFALQKLTETGGQYAGGAIAQSDTLSGKFSTLQDNIDSLARRIGTVLSPAIKGIVDQAIGALNAINQLFAADQRSKAFGLNIQQRKKILRQAEEEAKEIALIRGGGKLDPAVFNQLKQEREKDLIEAYGFEQGLIIPEIAAPKIAELPALADVPKKDQFRIGDVVGGGSGGRASGVDKTNQLLGQQQEAYNNIRKSQLRLITLNGDISELEKILLQNKFDYQDAVDRINETVAAGQRAELIGYEKLIQADRDRLATKDALTKDLADADAFGKIVQGVKPVNEELEKIRAFSNDIGAQLNTGITDALVGAVNGTKRLGESFQELAADILTAVGKALILKAVTTAIGTAGGGGEAGSGLLGLLFRANGGPVSANRPYIVGERGPELYIPGANGSITNNDQFEAARKAMGGSNNSSNDAFAENAEAIGTSTSYAKEKVMERERIASINSNPIDVRAETTVINNVEYVTVEQFSQGMKSTARDAQAKVLSDLRNRPATRAQVGIR